MHQNTLEPELDTLYHLDILFMICKYLDKDKYLVSMQCLCSTKKLNTKRNICERTNTGLDTIQL